VPNATDSRAYIAVPAQPGLQALRVVAIGGGTGLSTLLRGLKRYVLVPGEVPGSRAGTPPCTISDLTAIVTVSDDGGSSGRLRTDLNMLPPGDIRNCMVALSEDSHLLSKLFQYRFPKGSDLENHSFGNLFVAALSGITGDFAQAVQMSSQVLATRGRIFPACNSSVALVASMDDGTTVRGETNITASKQRILQLRLEPADVAPLPESLEAIATADLITLGPGSLFTSLITNLLVDGVAEALRKAKGTRVFICNLMTQANESIGLTASQHIQRIFDHAGDRIFDYALINTQPVSPTLLAKYEAEGQQQIVADLDRVQALGVQPIAGNFAFEGEVLRHEYDRVTEALLRLGIQGRP